MVTVIKKGTSRSKIRQLLTNMKKRSRKGFEAHKFCGILQLNKDAVEIQKRLRDEW